MSVLHISVSQSTTPGGQPIYRISKPSAWGRRTIWTYYTIHNVLSEIYRHGFTGPVKIRAARPSKRRD